LWWGDFPEFILPTPGSVVTRFVEEIFAGQLLHHLLITMMEVMLGLLLGSLSAVILGYVVFKSKFLDRLLSPVLIASQAIPVVAIAPLIVLWFGSGIWSKVLVCGIIVFFPILINTIIGLRAIPKEFLYLLTTLHAHPFQIFRYLEVPASLAIFLAGMRIGATLSVTGAIVGEFIGADQGLGFLINVARGQYDTAMVFVVIIVLITLAVTLYVIFVAIENRLLKWEINRN
jgi:NitT/TauT family transport system permease protein